MRLAWMSDIHLNFLTPIGVDAFASEVLGTEPAAVLISGDVAEADSVVPLLRQFIERVGIPTYFVLGNHDFYRGGVAEVRAEAGKLRGKAHYLTTSGVVTLCPGVALIGHDGWYDGRNGDYTNTDVDLNDFLLIADYAGAHSKAQRKFVMERLAQEAADHFARVLPEALAHHDEVIAVTHVPPFAEASFFRGVRSTPDFLPFHSNRCVGEVLVDVMGRFPEKRLTVLAGHTHGAGTYRPLPNVVVRTGEAEYRRPRVTDVLVVGEDEAERLAA